MINLLPPQEKQKFILEKRGKLVAILGMIILISLICLILILLSIRFYILAETDYQKNTLNQLKKEEQTQDLTDLAPVIQNYNNIISQLDSFYKKEIYFNKALDIIMNASNSKNLYLTNFSLVRDEAGMIQIKVSGISDTRDNLLLFKKSIEQNNLIKNPYFSPESWVSQKNVNFSLTFKIEKNG